MTPRQVQANARAVLLAAHRRFGMRMFPVNRTGPNWEPLKAAERMGWAWFEGDRCGISSAGELELDGYELGADARPACVSWDCPICGATVRQPEGDTGLPEDVPCPQCHRNAMQAADRMVEQLREQG